MIVDLHKYLLIGSRGEMDHFFSLAQRSGFLEFIGLSHKKALDMPEDAKTLLAAIKIIRQHTAPADEPYTPDLDPVSLASHIVKLHVDFEKLGEEQRLLKIEMARVAPFGHFSHADIEYVEQEGKRAVQFFCMKSDLAAEISLPSELIYVGTEYDLDYFVAINKEKTQYPKMIEVIIDRPIGDLKKRLRQVELEITQTEKEIHDAARARPYLQSGLADYLNEYHLQLAKHDAASPLGESLFAIEAWIPSTRVHSLQGLLSGLDIYAEEIAIEEHDKIPTYMENKGPAKIGEDLVEVYDTPAATDKDPSVWVLLFFSLFFAIIVSDAGYGLVYLCIGLFLKWKFKKASDSIRRFLRLTLIASSACIIWGILTASFFGIKVGPDNPFRKTSFLHYMAVRKAEYHIETQDDVYEEYVKQFPAVSEAQDGHDFLVKASHIVDGKLQYDALDNFYDSILLEFALFLGVIHLSLSFLRNMKVNWTGLGWIIFMIGGYFYFPSYVDATSFLNFMGWISKPVAYAIGVKLLLGGLGLVFLIALLQGRKWGALHELTNSIQIFGDVLSYLRLYALALAGVIMAGTFNDLGLQFGFLGLISITLVGQIINLGLAIMSGVIHGLRLNFLEWYRYSFEGGGRAFNPLRIRKIK
jgi:V/A-type H+-transporting ATPase subunit I